MSGNFEAFASFLGRLPHTTNGDDLRCFQFAQVEQSAQPPKMNGQTSALCFFLRPPRRSRSSARRHYPRKLPRVLTPDQVRRLIEAARGPGPGLKHKAAPSIACGAGLCGCEETALGR
jgi:integrase/recombinase XerD